MRRRKWFNANRAAIAERLPGECCNCGATELLDLHHIVPLALGGSNYLSNIAVLCADCHGKAHAHDAWEQRRRAQRAGIERARRRGTYRGRPADPDLHDRITQLLLAGRSIRATADEAGCSTSTVQRVKALSI